MSEESKDFIRKCLKISEEQRISWLDIFKHPLVKNSFQDYVVQQNNMESQANFIINQLRQYIYQQRVNLEDIFKAQQLTKDSKL